jgi:4-hydroxy-3-polyprenylbenzoate decarboxylase
MKKKKVIVAIGGASGSTYAGVLFEKLLSLQSQWESIGCVLSDNAVTNWELEIGKWDPSKYPFTFYDKKDFMAPFASGSAKYDTMIIIPCSMGLIGRINAGVSDDLITRAADVILKERRRLILVPRETPLSTIHLKNMLELSQAGAIICPAAPSFYFNADTRQEIVATVVDRILDLAGFDIETRRWSETE